MTFDPNKLTPTPWHTESWHGIPSSSVRDAKGVPLMERCTGAAVDDLEFVVVARQAYGVMMRRGWHVRPYQTTGDGTWWEVVEIEDGDLITALGALAECECRSKCPFTALVEADKWYAEHAEASK